MRIAIIGGPADVQSTVLRYVADETQFEAIEVFPSASAWSDAPNRADFDCLILSIMDQSGEDRAFWGAGEGHASSQARIVIAGPLKAKQCTDLLASGVVDVLPASSLSSVALSSLALAAAFHRAEAFLKVRAEAAKRAGEHLNFMKKLIHDVKSPIRRVATMAEYLGEDLAAGRIEDGQQMLGIISENAERLDYLLEQLADYSFYSDPFGTATSIDIKAVVMRAVERVKARLGTDFSLEEDYSQLTSVAGHPEQLEVLLLALIHNAALYNRAEDPRVEVTVSSHDAKLALTVQDNGIGIADEKHNEIFEPFVRLHLNSEIAGAGMGLAIAKRVVEALSGRIWVTSEPGAGSSFHVELPISQ